MDLGAALDATQREYVDQDTDLDATGQSVLRSYSVADTGKPVRVTLAWTDPPPATVTGQRVRERPRPRGERGRAHLPRQLAGRRRSRSRAARPTSATTSRTWCCPPGTDGRMSVKVVAKSLGGDGVPGNGKPLDQDFALVVSNAQEQASSPVLVQGGVTVDDAIDGQNGDGALEPGEYFTLHQGVRNTGTDVATGVSLDAHRERRAERRRRARRPTRTSRPTPSSRTRPPYEGTLADRAVLRRRRDRHPERDQHRGRDAARAGHDPDRPPGPADHADADRDGRHPGRQRRRRRLEPVHPGQRPHQGPRRPDRQHRPQLRGRPEGGADEPRQLHDRPADRARGRAEQRRRRPRRHRLRRRGLDRDRLGRERRAVHRQLPPAGRPAVALRRQAAAGHLEAARERPLRERHRLAARLEPHDPHSPVRPERERAGDRDPGGAARRS